MLTCHKTQAVGVLHRSLKKNGYNTNLKFDRTFTDKNNEKNKTRKRKITWFNPLFNINLTTNVATPFLALIDKHFPKNKRLSKILIINTIKVSYSCLPNNNHRLLQLHTMKESTQDIKLCNFQLMRVSDPKLRVLTNQIIG